MHVDPQPEVQARPDQLEPPSEEISMAPVHALKPDVPRGGGDGDDCGPCAIRESHVPPETCTATTGVS